jgi:hypothetical protein
VVSKTLANASEARAREGDYWFPDGFAGAFGYGFDVVADDAGNACGINEYACGFGEGFGGFDDGFVEFLFSTEHNVGFSQVSGEHVI